MQVVKHSNRVCLHIFVRKAGFCLKIRLVAALVMFFVLVGVVLGAVLFGPALLSGAGSGMTDTSQPAAMAGNPIVRENAQPGSIGWKIPTSRAASIQIQAYANVTS